MKLVSVLIEKSTPVEGNDLSHGKVEFAETYCESTLLGQGMPLFDSNDDSSLCTSSSSCNETTLEARPRSLFPSYWQKVGGKVTTTTETSLPVPAIDAPITATDSGRKNSEIPISSVLDTTIESTSISPKRRIFGRLSHSTPTLSSSSFTEIKIRKSLSSSSLPDRKSKPSSCLRPSRYSGRARRDSDASVTFSPKIDIVVFQIPCEQWAAEGWAQYFV